MKYSNKEYEKIAEQKSPNSKVFRNTLFAFVIGGIICTVGQAFSELYKNVIGMGETAVKNAVPVTMIFLGALFTGFNIYNKLAKYGGGGTLVPITGFANAIVSPAIEFKREGLILGLAVKMFTVAGPVIVYGICASVIAGFIYFLVGQGA